MAFVLRVEACKTHSRLSDNGPLPMCFPSSLRALSMPLKAEFD